MAQDTLEPIVVRAKPLDEVGPVEGAPPAAPGGQSISVLEATDSGSPTTEEAEGASSGSDSSILAVSEPPEDPETMRQREESEKVDAEMKALRRERELLALKNALRSEILKSELADMVEEKERLSLENAVFRERIKAEMIELQGRVDRMTGEIDEANKLLTLSAAKARLAQEEELAALRLTEQRLSLEASVAQKEASIEMEQLRLSDMRSKSRRGELEVQVAELQATLALKEKREQVRNIVADTAEAPVYLKEPFVDGTLHVSDRRIELDGPIWGPVASFISERINFYNNQSSEYPIFIVIEASPGGSVMAGYSILKAMEGSKAPVYVVVKSYAASMAAVITAMAERSYAYPNAIILHHELSWYGVIGNLTQQKEFVEGAAEWWRRLASPVAQKMGIALDEFKALMYQKSSTGDWQEFADVAVEYRWVDQVVDRIWEKSIQRNPEPWGLQIFFAERLPEKRDENGKAFVELPALAPFDFYFLHNPADYYRIQR